MSGDENDNVLQPNLDTEDVDVLKLIRNLQTVFEKRLEQVNSRMDDLEKRVARSRSSSPSRGKRPGSRSPPPKNKRTERLANRGRDTERSRRGSQSDRHWADRNDTVLDLPPLKGDEWVDDDDDELATSVQEGGGCPERQLPSLRRPLAQLWKIRRGGRSETATLCHLPL